MKRVGVILLRTMGFYGCAVLILCLIAQRSILEPMPWDLVAVILLPSFVYALISAEVYPPSGQ